MTDEMKDTLAVYRAHLDQMNALLRDQMRMFKNFKVSDTPRSGPEGISGHSGTPDPPNHKEIA